MRIKLFFLILLSILSINSISAQNSNKKITVTGNVLDAANKPIANAIVMIDGQKTNSITDSKGNFKIKIKREAVKIGIFTFGSGILEEDINGRTKINLTFRKVSSQSLNTEDVAPGEEGINTGYNVSKKKNLTTDINKIDGTDKKYASYATIYDMIQREVSGVQVTGKNIVIQGSRNMWGEIPPLLVVDGVYVNSIEDIPPSSVKSIEVLKGSSAAIYGSRGFGGVILIKTKIENE